MKTYNIKEKDFKQCEIIAWFGAGAKAAMFLRLFQGTITIDWSRKEKGRYFFLAEGIANQGWSDEQQINMTMWPLSGAQLSDIEKKLITLNK